MIRALPYLVILFGPQIVLVAFFAWFTFRETKRGRRGVFARRFVGFLFAVTGVVLITIAVAHPGKGANVGPDYAAWYAILGVPAVVFGYGLGWSFALLGQLASCVPIWRERTAALNIEIWQFAIALAVLVFFGFSLSGWLMLPRG
jgi:hypothetical protein